MIHSMTGFGREEKLINDKKIVVAKIGKNFSWFSFVTLLITTYGIASYSYGVYVIRYYLSNNIYLYLLALATLVTIIIGYWSTKIYITKLIYNFISKFLKF